MFREISFSLWMCNPSVEMYMNQKGMETSENQELLSKLHLAGHVRRRPTVLAAMSFWSEGEYVQSILSGKHQSQILKLSPSRGLTLPLVPLPAHTCERTLRSFLFCHKNKIAVWIFKRIYPTKHSFPQIIAQYLHLRKEYFSAYFLVVFILKYLLTQGPYWPLCLLPPTIEAEKPGTYFPRILAAGGGHETQL